jgi:hypothetical protein
MQITEITVGASSGFNHPYEEYSNFKPSVTIRATIDPYEDATTAAKVLQMKAEDLVDSEKARILAALKIEQETERAERIVDHRARIVQTYEATLAKATLLENPEQNGLTDDDCERLEQEVSDAEANIDDARKELASAQAHLATLKS